MRWALDPELWILYEINISAIKGKRDCFILYLAIYNNFSKNFYFIYQGQVILTIKVNYNL